LRGRRTQPNLTRMQFVYVPFDFFLAFFFMTLVLAVGPLSQSKSGARCRVSCWKLSSAWPLWSRTTKEAGLFPHRTRLGGRQLHVPCMYFDSDIPKLFDTCARAYAGLNVM
jgi:hypothetical protein